MAAVSIVNGNVWVNMWATAYALPMWRRTHGAVRECWHEGSSCEYSYIYMLCIFYRYTNRDYVKNG